MMSVPALHPKFFVGVRIKRFSFLIQIIKVISVFIQLTTLDAYTFSRVSVRHIVFLLFRYRLFPFLFNIKSWVFSQLV